MILDLYVVLFIVSFLFLFYGWTVKADLYRIIGSTLIFLLGVMLMTSVPSLLGRLDVNTGNNVTVSGATTTITEIYTEYTNHTLGFFISITGILSFILVMVDRRTARASL